MSDIEPAQEDHEYWRARAVSALRHFGADLTRATARRLLPMWRDYAKLTPADVTAVLAAFPNSTAGDL